MNFRETCREFGEDLTGAGYALIYFAGDEDVAELAGDDSDLIALYGPQRARE